MRLEQHGRIGERATGVGIALGDHHFELVDLRGEAVVDVVVEARDECAAGDDDRDQESDRHERDVADHDSRPDRPELRTPAARHRLSLLRIGVRRATLVSMTTGFPIDPRAIDLMIAFPFKKADVYAFLREQVKDDESKAGSGDLAMPAGYMFSDVGDEPDPDEDVIETCISAMDAVGVASGLFNVQRTGHRSRSGDTRTGSTSRSRSTPTT